MVKIIVGIDIAKNVFQVHAADRTGAMVYTKKLSRGQVLPFFAKQPPTLIGMEACATSHHWARELIKLGHEVHLLPPTAVKPFVKRGKKNDAADAAAICEAMVRPNIHTVPVKTEEQQSVLALHTVREQLVVARTGFVNAVRAHFAEHGMVVGLGRGKLAELATMRLHLPDRTAFAVDILLGRIKAFDADIARIEKKLIEFHKTCEESCNLATIPSVGPLTATLIVAKIGDPSRFKRGRNFAAWLGMVPRQNSSGGKDRLGAITKAGDQAIRRMLFLGATSMVWRAKPVTWLGKLRGRKPAKLAAMAQANKTARIIWAVLTRGEIYRETTAAA
jgi:transposase